MLPPPKNKQKKPFKNLEDVKKEVKDPLTVGFHCNLTS